MKFNTLLLHGAFDGDESRGATNTPIYQATAFQHQSAEKLEHIFQGTAPGFVYTRIGNPTVDALERRLALLEGGAGAVACASGMAAVTLAVINLLRSGDEVVASSGIFGGTHSLLESLSEFGITARYAEDSSPDSFARCMNEKTKLMFIETVGNPKLDVPDIKALAELAHARGIPLVVDSTVTTPYLVQPLRWGADIVIHSMSKYINGSANSIGGVIIDGGRFKWRAEQYPALQPFAKYGAFAYLAKLRKGVFKDFGPCVSPFNAFLTAIGLETLGLRMDRLCENAQKLAEFLQSNAAVTVVNYPGLPEHQQHETASRQFGGKFGAILTIRTGSKEKAFQVINRLKYAANLSNIGDVRTLVVHPASTIYAADSLAAREAAGVYEDLIRISVGLEDIEDLTADFEQALQGL